MDSGEQQVVTCAGIELGGTNCVVGVGTVTYVNGVAQASEVKEKEVISTESPEITLEKILAWFKDRKFEKFGIASFGPVGLNKSAQDYGSITSTPKAGWDQYPIGPNLQKALQLNGYGFDTDVNACAVAELKLGNYSKQSSLAYITVGTGVGVGLIVNGQCVHGLVHPEGGHIRVSKLPEDLDFPGVCSYHGDCLEGLCTNVSIAKRLNLTVDDLPNVPDSNDIWRRVAHYLAGLCLSLTLIVSVETIIIGGGVLNREILYPLIRQEFKKLLNNYVQHPRLNDLDNYIKAPALGNNVGLIGAFLLE